MKINKNTSLLEPCQQTPSPNKDNRPPNTPISLIVIHSISLPPGEYGGDAIERFFQNRLDKNEHPYFAEIEGLEVSSHILIKRDGTVVQFVPFDERAWHAGVSDYCGRERCNDFSVGIELEGTDTDTFEMVQYQQLSQLIRLLQQTYPEISDNITGHSDIAPGRKTDPGIGFDWNILQQQLTHLA